jgi:hypothetical protein
MILEEEPPVYEADEAPPGPLGDDEGPEPLAFEELGRPQERPVEDGGPRLRPSTEPEEQVILRVVNRVGYARPRTPRDAVKRVKEMAHAVPTLAPDEYVRRFVRIGQVYCHASLPDCGPCPLLETCRLGQRRLRNGEVRRGRWGSRAP